ncbi:hypothetical protein H4219_004969, partial [Mycoemilia scoparia]
MTYTNNPDINTSGVKRKLSDGDLIGYSPNKSSLSFSNQPPPPNKKITSPNNLPQHIKDNICQYLGISFATETLDILSNFSASWNFAVQQERWSHFRYPELSDDNLNNSSDSELESSIIDEATTTASTDNSDDDGQKGTGLEEFLAEGYKFVQSLWLFPDEQAMDQRLLNKRYPCLKEITLPHNYSNSDEITRLVKNNKTIQVIHIDGEEKTSGNDEENSSSNSQHSFLFETSPFKKALESLATSNYLSQLDFTVPISTKQMYVTLKNLPILSAIEISYLVYDGAEDDLPDANSTQAYENRFSLTTNNPNNKPPRPLPFIHKNLRKFDLFTYTVDTTTYNHTSLEDVLSIFNTKVFPNLEHIDLPHICLPGESPEYLDFNDSQ